MNAIRLIAVSAVAIVCCLGVTPAIAACVKGSLSSAAAGNVFTPTSVFPYGGYTPLSYSTGQFNVSVSGTFVATWQILRSIDGGSTFVPVSALGVPYNFTGTMSETFTEPQTDVRYQIAITSYTSGTLNYSMCQ
jgi:hypothetical protein